jgi:hypothetical protein
MHGSVPRIGIATLLSIAFANGGAAEPPRVAVFDFSLMNTSPAPTTEAEQERLRRLSGELRELLAASGRYALVDLGPVREEMREAPSIRDCNGCELALAKTLGADLAAYGWVQKVSNLILNINLVIEDARTGKRLDAASVDIRGNTDESWDRGLRFLVRERVLAASP